jgi:hypothetical protein
LINYGLRFDPGSLELNEAFKLAEIYDPWQNKWINVVPENGKISLPDFKRSLIVRIRK